MLCFTIGLENKFTGKLKFDDIKNCFNKNKIFYSVYNTKNNKKIFIKTFLDNDETIKTVCDILSQYIFENYINPYVNKYVNEYYGYLSDLQKKEMIDKFFDENEKDYISKKLYNYLSDDNSLIVDGFVNFRLKDYLYMAIQRIEVIAEDIIIKNEYSELIGFLKYFVNTQNSKYDEINIVKYKNGSYNLYDSCFNIIENNDRNEFMFEFADEEFCVNDVLINDLINLSPTKVVIHNKDNFETKEILKTVESIFENNFSYCKGCKLCKNID